MERNPDLSDYIPSKEELMAQDDFLFQQNLNEAHSMQNKNSEEKESHINKIIEDESFEKAFNEIFLKKSNEIEPEEIDPPVIEYQPEKIIIATPCPEKKMVIKVEENEDKIFPFTEGHGLSKALQKIGLTANYTSSKISLLNIYNNQGINNSKFKTTDYYIDENGKKKKQKKKRKFKPDDIRKKIKARFHKVIKNIINSKLKNAGSKKLFDFLPQSFISNITIRLNKQAMDLTYENLIEKNYVLKTKIKKGNPDLEKYNKNLDVLNYLKENPQICKNSDFEKIKNMKYIDILKAYFSSFEFEQSIIELNKKKEKIDYIEEYINKSLTYVNFFAFNKKKFNDKTILKKNNNTFKISYYDDEEFEESE